MNMAKYQGPCRKCGVHIERIIKHGKLPRCLDCALADQVAQQRGFAEGTHPELAKSVEAGRRSGVEMRERKGKAHTHWVRGMNAYLRTLNTTEGDSSDTVSP